MSLIQTYIRNFAIIAHVDHGKSTLADRFLEICGLVDHAQAQTLDSNPIERERGITIQLAPVRMEYTALNGETYTFHLIDTPGHVDFSYEVSRALAACEGAILLVDATQGVQAQTLAHFRQAQRLNLSVIPVINKVDLPSAEVEATMLEMMELLHVEESEIMKISAKSGLGVRDVLEAAISRFPAPVGNREKPLRALVFNSDYTQHQGVRAWVRIIDGELKDRDNLLFVGTNVNFPTPEIGTFSLKADKTNTLSAGEVGYVITGLKEPRQVQPGDTLIKSADRYTFSDSDILPGYKPPQAMVFLSLFPTETAEFINLTQALEKLRLIDSSLNFTPESSPLLGHGYRVGFLGLLHAEVVQERLEREFGLSVIATTPTVSFQIRQRGEIVTLNNPTDLPDPSTFETILEPILAVEIFVPHAYIGPVMELMQSKRGKMQEMISIGHQVKILYDLPLAEMVGDFYSRLKSATSGYASLDYEFKNWQEADLVKLDFMMAGELIAVLSQIVPRDRAVGIGRQYVEKLATLIPRHQFEIAIQAAIGGKILARASVKAFRKDVTAKLYGGDQTRKDKLLEKQKKGKKKMKQLGRVTIEPDTFWKLLQ